MRVSLVTALMFAIVAAALGAGGMFFYINSTYDLRAASRQQAERPNDVAFEDNNGVKAGKKQDDAKAKCAPAKTAENEKPKAEVSAKPDAAPVLEKKPEETKPEAAPDPKSEAKPDEKKNLKERADGLKKAVEKARNGELPELDELDEFLGGKQVDFKVTLSGTVTDSRGNPVANAEVSADANQNMGEGTRMVYSISTGGSKIATSDANGNFSGVFETKVSEKATVTLTVKARCKGYADSKKINVDAKNGDEKSGLKLAMQGAGKVQGRVVDVSGRGVKDARVSLNSKGGGDGGFYIDGDFSDYMPGGGKNSALTDQNGDFTIEDVAEGSYGISLKAAGFKEKSGPRNVDVKADQATRLDSDFVLTVTSSLKATFVGEDGTPINGWCSIEISDSEGKVVKRLNGSTANGVLALNDPPVGGFNVVVKMWGYHDTDKIWANFSADQPTDLGTLTLKVNPEAGKSRVIR